MSNDFNKLSLSFNEEALFNDLIMDIVKGVQQMLTLLFDNIMLSDLSKKAKEGWHINMNRDFFGKIVDNITGYVGTDNWNAFLSNYGTGSKMDRNNPWLEEYLDSKYFNPERDKGDLIVTGRHDGMYDSPDYESGYGETTREATRGDLVGVNLETEINPATKRPYYTPVVPTHGLEDSMQRTEEVFYKHMQEIIDNFDFSKYLIGGV